MKRRLAALGCSIALASSLMAGCVAAGGVEPDKVLQNAFGVVSYEGSGSLSFQVTAGEAAKGYPDAAKLNNAVVELPHVKQQDKSNSSVTGVFKTSSGNIPFEAAQSNKEWVIQAEGASKPLVLEDAHGQTQQDSAAAPGFGLDFSSLNMEKLQNHLGSILSYAPTLDSFAVSDANATINGEALSLKKIHAELKGGELTGIIQKTLANLLADGEKGDTLIRSIIGDLGYDGNNAFMFSIVKESLRSLAEDASALDMVLPTGDFLNNSNVLKLDLYVDGASQIRRTAFELDLQGLTQLDNGVSAVTITGSFDRWNINGTVTADKLSAEGGIKLAEGGGLAKYLLALDKSSTAYKFLVEELKVNRKHIELPPVGSGTPTTEVRPFLQGDTTMVPVRLVTEQLDAQVGWNPDTYEVTVTDIWSGKKIVFKIGSTSVLVDGTEQTLDASAVLGGDTTYVPVRIIAETFGAEVLWNPDTYVVTIVRN
ncbi:MAG: copper amine oxidase [Paenibacillaceae bacterium]|nr:copper amine oxidase [Paenibacillaceae bacterium]